MHVYSLSLEKIISFVFHKMDDREREYAPQVLLYN